MKYLIVDDHALVRSALSMMLLDRDPSAEVLTAGDVPTSGVKARPPTCSFST